VSATAPGEWSRKLAAYRQPKLSRSLLELAITAGSLAVIWVLAWMALKVGWWWLALPLVLPAAGFLVRLFMIQHDCGHGSFFENRAANDWVGRAIGVLTLTPYDYWRRTHAMHHAASGNLDRRGLGAIETLTVAEYQALKPSQQLGYRLYRNPFVMFGLGPAFVFFIMQRLPLGLMREWRAWASTLANSAGIVVGLGVLIWLVGAGPVLVINITTMLVAATIGVWLFFVQHQFDGVAWSRNGEWKRHDSALSGSSHYDLPPVLRWFTANIGVHHVHHLSSRIPCYRLTEVLRDHPELNDVSRLGLKESFRCARLALWDESAGRMVSFKELRTAQA
jgi:acyl-lipid omega-6 desaturase (Delta-12 desaturase)